jgi:[ribosomal protein S5]-alanine N-acetyltransferase
MREGTSERLIEAWEAFDEGNTRLRLVTLDDCTPRYVSWLCDAEINRYLETRWQEQSLQSVRLFVLGLLNSADSYLFAITSLEDLVHIGNIKIGPVSSRHLYADISYFIGERDRWGRGHASTAIRIASRISFARLGLHRVQAGVYSNNVGSCRALEKVGFRLEGRFRSQLRGTGGWEDHLWYGLLREEFVDSARVVGR